MAVYGETLVAFPELFEKVPVWSDDPSDFEYYYIILPSVTSSMFRNTFGVLEKGATGTILCENKIKIGSFFRPNDTGTVFRVTKEMGWDKIGGFYKYSVEEVKGTTIDNSAPLQINGGYFD